ncbi:MAG: phosphatase PAP2 family protein [Gemmatimonadaceae bacterium]|nr:phosphatase PAP2 family protein [Gemmatimonadaceae bacterium]
MFDTTVRNVALAHQSAVARTIFLVFTTIGSPSMIVPATIAVALWLWHLRGLRIAGGIVIAPAVATAICLAIKELYARTRPAGGALLHELTYSFPSGHATASGAVFPTIAYVLWREELVAGSTAALLGIVGPLAIGASRIYLDVHWTTDVLGGWCIGALVAGLSAVAYERVRTTTRHHGRPIDPQH